jgi:hypothetical protein
MAATHVTQSGTVLTTSADPAAPAITVVAGDVICGYVFWFSSTVTLTSVSDGQGNAYTLRLNPTEGVGELARAALFHTTAGVASSGSLTVTAHLSGSDDATIIVHAVRGINTTTPRNTDDAQGQDGPGTGTDAVTSTAQTPSMDGCYVAGFTANAGYSTAYTIGTGFTTAFSANDGRSEYRIQAAAASVAATFTSPDGSEPMITMMIALAPAATVVGGGLPLAVQQRMG